MMRRGERFGGLGLGLLLVASAGLGGCDSKKDAPAPQPLATRSTSEPEPEPPPAPRKKAPVFSVDEVSPQVGFERSNLTLPSGAPDAHGHEQFKAELAGAKEFIEGKDVELLAARLAKPEWLAIYIEELFSLGAAAVKVTTETRSNYPKSVAFVAGAALGKPEACSSVGMIGEDRSTMVWKLSGGAALRKGRGMSGPDFSITGDTLLAQGKKCSSDLFVVQGAKGVEWGLVYDFAASAMVLEAGPFRRAATPSKKLTPGRPVAL